MLPRLRILLIEDHRELALLTAELLRDNGQEVEVAFNGKDGCQRAAQSPPNIVICDLRLPDQKGQEVARTIRGELAANPPLLIGMTAGDVAALQKNVQESAFDVFLSKPLIWPLFEECVETLTKARRATQQAAPTRDVEK